MVCEKSAQRVLLPLFVTQALVTCRHQDVNQHLAFLAAAWVLRVRADMADRGDIMASCFDACY